MPEEPQIVEIDIEELAIDKFNIRQGVWNYDEELIKSVREKGIRNPLLIRPVPPEGRVKYGIVCGSRRYNAALEVGLRKVRCIAQQMTDIEAMEESMIENRQRVNTPTWMDIEYVGLMYVTHRRNGLSHAEARDVISRTGISPYLIEKYIRIYNLPSEIKGLLRDPEERTQKQREYISLFRYREPRRLLPIGHANFLYQLVGLSLDKQMEVALFVINYQAVKVEKLIQMVKDNPNTKIEDLYQTIIQKYGIVGRNVRFDKEVYDALSTVCMDRQTSSDNLIARIVKDWLIEHGFFKRAPVLQENGGDIKTKSRVSRKTLMAAGYRLNNTDGDVEIYQKPVKGASGFIKIYLHKSGVGIFRLTAGSYENGREDDILLTERDRVDEVAKTSR